MCEWEIFHVCVMGLSGAGKTHFINAVTIGDGYTIRPTTGFYEETLKLDERRQIHLIECPIKALELRPESFCGLLWVMDARASYEDLHASRNQLLSVAHRFERIGIVYNVRDGPVETFRDRNQWLQLDCFPHQLFVIDYQSEIGWEERVWRLFRFFTGENGG